MIPKDKPIVTHTAKEIRDIEEKAKVRQAYREYFLKQKYDPFLHTAANGSGYIDDPAYRRYEATHSFMSRITHMKPTFKTTRLFFAWMVAPIGILWYFGTKTRAEFDAKCRRGEISYADRMNKMV